MNRLSGVYKITNKANGKMYVGSSFDILQRWHKHVEDVEDRMHHSYKFQNDWVKYKPISFVFEILELVHEYAKLKETEQKWIDFYKSYDDDIGYNVSMSATEKILPVKECFKNHNNEIIRAIANRDIPYLQQIFNQQHQFLDDVEQCLDILFAYDFSHIFKDDVCIFCNQPSAHVQYSDVLLDYVYFCPHCIEQHLGTSSQLKYGFTIEVLIGKILRMWSLESEKFLLQVFNLDYDKEKSKILELETLRKEKGIRRRRFVKPEKPPKKNNQYKS